MACHFLLQGMFPTQGSNLGLPHCRQTLYRLSHQGSPSPPQMFSCPACFRSPPQFSSVAQSYPTLCDPMDCSTPGLPVRYSSGRGRKRKDDLNRSRLLLFRQGGATVGLTTRLSAERDQGSSIFVGRLVEAIGETLIRQDVLGIF